MAVMVGPFKVTGQPDEADVFPTFGCVGGRHFIFREDRRERAFRHTGAAINTGIGVNVDPGPLVHRLAGEHTFHRADIDTTAISYT
jgi:hypothetical protein